MVHLKHATKVAIAREIITTPTVAHHSSHRDTLDGTSCIHRQSREAYTVASDLAAALRATEAPLQVHAHDRRSKAIADGGQALVLDSAVGHGEAFAAGSGHGCACGVGLKRPGMGEAGSVVADVGEDPGRSSAAIWVVVSVAAARGVEARPGGHAPRDAAGRRVCR